MTRQVSSRVSLKFSEMIRAPSPFVFTLLFLIPNKRGISVNRRERSYRAGMPIGNRGRQPRSHSLQFASDPAMSLRVRQGGRMRYYVAISNSLAGPTLLEIRTPVDMVQDRWRDPIRHGPAVPVV